MSTEQLQKQVARWKLLALLGLAFGMGQLSAQYFGTADAQSGVMKVRLDTSNCSYGLATGSSPYNVPSGALLMQVLRQGSAAYDTAWIYNVCK